MRIKGMPLSLNNSRLVPRNEHMSALGPLGEAILDSVFDGVVAADAQARVTHVNPAAVTIMEWEAQPPEGSLLSSVFPVDLYAASAPRLATVTTGLQRQFTVEYRLTRLYDGEGALQGFVIAFRDATSLQPVYAAMRVRDGDSGRNGTETAIEASASPIHDSLGGVIGAVIVAHDVTAARDLSAKLTRLALYDDLTGLPRRALLADRLHRALARAERNQRVAAVIFLDLDGFKPVNDSLGHSVGDALLKVVAQRLVACVRGSDTVSRHGGDEFIILLSDVRHAGEVSCCEQKVRAAFDSPFAIGEHSLQVSASIGTAVFPDMGRSAEELIHFADAAMYENKKNAKAAI